MLPDRIKEQLHQLTFAQITSGILIIDPESHTILDVNPVAAHMIGLPAGEIIGRVCHQFICQAQLGNCPITDLNQVVDNSERQLMTANKTVIPVLKTVHSCVIENKEYLIENFIDISALKGHQIQLEKRETLLERIYETSGVGMALLKPNATFYRVNSAFCTLVGYTSDELLSGQYTITHPDDIEKGNILLQQLSEGKMTSNVMEKRYISKTGQIIEVIHHASVIFDVMGFHHLFILQVEDITPIKNAKVQAEESDRIKTAFLHNLSHEVRTPANAIQGFSQLLNEPGLSQTDREEYFAIIKQSVSQLLDILNDTVEIAKLETNQVTLLIKSFQVNTFLRNLYRRASKKFSHNLVEYRLEIPDHSDQFIMLSDELRLEQILMYLLSNAFKFTKHGTVTLGYSLENNGQLRFYVRDTGIGIPKNKHEAVFEKFRQTEETTTRVYGGLGLGLTLAKGLTGLLGGRITLDSEPAEGTTVSVFLNPGTEIRIKPVHDHLLRVDKSTDILNGKKILIAEDNDVNFDYLRIALKRLGASTLRASDGSQAVSICQAQPDIDLILMDIQMPGMNGYEATRSIRTFLPEIPIIAQTAYSEDFNREMALEAGCTNYLSKPIELQNLINMVTRYAVDFQQA